MAIGYHGIPIPFHTAASLTPTLPLPSTAPLSGAIYRQTTFRSVRRLLLPRIRYHIYFEVYEASGLVRATDRDEERGSRAATSRGRIDLTPSSYRDSPGRRGEPEGGFAFATRCCASRPRCR
jgi:hypothetical protein